MGYCRLLWSPQNFSNLLSLFNFLYIDQPIVFLHPQSEPSLKSIESLRKANKGLVNRLKNLNSERSINCLYTELKLCLNYNILSYSNIYILYLLPCNRSRKTSTRQRLSWNMECKLSRWKRRVAVQMYIEHVDNCKHLMKIMKH